MLPNRRASDGRTIEASSRLPVNLLRNIGSFSSYTHFIDAQIPITRELEQNQVSRTEGVRVIIIIIGKTH